MSMVQLTIFQIVICFVTYTASMIILPSFFLKRRLAHRTFTERVLSYFLVGNFYFINLVLLLGLLHISYPATLIAGILIPFIIRAIKNKARIERFFSNCAVWSKRVLENRIGKRNAAHMLAHGIRRNLMQWSGKLFQFIRAHAFTFLMVAALMVAVSMRYGQHFITYFGYSTSDQPVHTYWINYLGRNQIFVAGVYPYGFHCVIYFLHAVFQIDTYVLMRVFGLTQTFYIFLMLAMVIDLITKTNYLGYVVAIFTVIFSGYTRFSVTRYVTTLPQEYGMLFILPSIYFILQFFREQMISNTMGLPDEDGKKIWKARGNAKLCLNMFAISFSLTFAVHFYDTIIAFLLCLGVAVGFGFLLFRKEYFLNIILAGIISMALAIAPMAAAFATGTELQGSLGWALSVIAGTRVEVNSGANGQLSDGQSVEKKEEASEQAVEEESSFVEMTEEQEESTEIGDVVQSTPTVRERIANLGKGVVTKLHALPGIINNQVLEYCFTQEQKGSCQLALIGLVEVFLLGIFLYHARSRWYGASVISLVMGIMLLMLMLVAGELHLPKLMDPERTCIYINYFIWMPFAFLVDYACVWLQGILAVLLPTKRFVWLSVIQKERTLQVMAAVLSLLFLAEFVMQGIFKEPIITTGLQTNGAMVCLTNIIRDEQDYTYTIVSASDERNMALDHAYHEELSVFLRKMEGYSPSHRITLPTKNVYFFIEKIPPKFWIPGIESRSIDENDAFNMLNYGIGTASYSGKYRFQTMARIYYWAQHFKELYPNDVTVYFENEEFVCYKLAQNPYNNYNLAIDYGYNTIDWNALIERGEYKFE